MKFQQNGNGMLSYRDWETLRNWETWETVSSHDIVTGETVSSHDVSQSR